MENYTISPSQICLLLFEQKIIDYNEEDYNKLLKGNSYTAYTFLMEKIRNLEITPAQLALDPCSGSVCIADVNTGQVKALVIYPSYDNNMLSGTVDPEYWAKLIDDQSDPLYNRATQGSSATTSFPKEVFFLISFIICFLIRL